MKALLYLKKRTLINKVKKAIRTPKTYIFFLLILFYIFGVVSFFVGVVQEVGAIGTPYFVSLITVITFLIKPTSIISYINRKGLVFKKADVHFAFQSPITPKMNLISTKIASFVFSFFIGIMFLLIGQFAFHAPILPTIIYMLFLMSMEPIFETGMIVILYGSEKISERTLKILKVLMYLIISVFVFGIVINLYFAGFTLPALNALLVSPWILGIPVVGWSVAIANVLFLGPTNISVIFSICYLVFFIGILIFALKMKCTGEFYEDAMKFAIDYEEARSRGRKGEVVQIGKKKKYKKAEITYKGKFAKAIFYRQILEYKKNRFFILGGRTVLILVAGIGLSILFKKADPLKEIGEYSVFIIPGIMLYIDFIFSGYLTKWGKELTYANLFLIPDTAINKLWYATLTEHIRSIIDGLILTIPVAITLNLSMYEIMLTLVACVLIQANKLYLRVFIHGIFRDSIGVIGKQMMHLLFYGIILAIAIIPTVFISIGLGANIGFISFNVILLGVTFGCMLAASEMFKKMEAVG